MSNQYLQTKYNSQFSRIILIAYIWQINDPLYFNSLSFQALHYPDNLISLLFALEPMLILFDDFLFYQLIRIQQNLMTTIQQAEIQNSVYLCTFECLIRQANIAMKFPCSYFATWSTPNGKVIVKTEKHIPKQNLVTFQEKIILTTELIYEHSKVQFLKRQTLVELFLVSKSRPDQNKLVGRVTIDLAKVINVNMYAQPTQFRLNFCSVEGSVIMQFQANDRKLTSLSVQSLDRSSFIDYVSRTALRGESKNHGFKNIGNSLQKQNQQNALKTDYQVATPTLPNHRIGFFNDNEGSKFILNKEYLKNDEAQPKRNSDSIKIPETIRSSSGVNTVKENTTSLQAPTFSDKNALNKSKQFSDSFTLKQKLAIKKQQSAELLRRQNRFFKADKIKQKTSVPIYTQIVKQANDRQNKGFQFLITKQNLKESSSLDGRCKMLEQELNQYKKKIEELDQKCKKAEKNNNKLGETNVELSSRINELIEDSKRMTENMKNAYESLTNKDKILNQKTGQISQKSQTISTLQFQKSSLKTKIESYVYEIQDLKKIKTKIQTLESQNTQLLNRSLEDKKKIEELEQNIVKQQNIIKDLKQSNLQLNQEIIKDQEAKVIVSNTLAQLQNQNINLQAKIQLLEQNGESSLKIQEKTNNNAFLQLQQDIGKKNEQIYQLKMIESYLKSKIDNISCQLQRQQQNCVEHLFIVNQQKQKNMQLTLKLQLIEQKSTTQNASLQNVETLNAHKNQQIQALKITITNLEQQKAQIINSTSNQHTRLEQIIQSLSQRLQSSELRNKDTTLLDQKNQLIQRIAELQLSNSQQIFQLNQQIGKLKDKISILHDSITILEKQKELSIDQKNCKDQTINEGEDNWQNRCLQNEMMINKLNSHLQDQINQNNHLEEAMIRYMDKQAKMKETLTVLQQQSKEIYGLVQQKQQNQIMYQKMVAELQRQVDQLKNMINNGSNISPLKHVYQYEQFQSSFPSSESKDAQNQQTVKFKEHLTLANEQMFEENKKLQHINDQLNKEIITINIFHNQSMIKLQDEISRLKFYSRELQSSIQQSRQIVSIKYRQYNQLLNNKQNGLLTLEQQVNQLKNTLDEIQQQKFGLESVNNEKDIRIMELQQYNQMLSTQISAHKMTPKQQSLIDVLAELKQNLIHNSSSIHNHWQSLLQNCLDKSIVGEDATKMFNLQQKSRLLSKELHKLKSQMLKTDWRNQHEKITFMGLFKKCETIVSQLIVVVESMNTNQSSFL